MNKKTMVHPYSGTLQLKKELSTDLHNSMDETKMHFLHGRSQHKKATYCMTLFMWHSGRGRLEGWKKVAEDWRWEEDKKAAWKKLLSDGTILYIIVVVET